MPCRELRRVAATAPGIPLFIRDIVTRYCCIAQAPRLHCTEIRLPALTAGALCQKALAQAYEAY